MKLPASSVKFVAYVRRFKTVEVIREAPTRIYTDLIFDLPANSKKPPFLRWVLHADPLSADKILAYYEPVNDPKALERGKPGEDKSYLAPSLDNEWNRTKTEKCTLTRLDSGEATFFILSEAFVKVVLNGSKLKGLFTLKPQDSGPIWVLERTTGPGQKIKDKKS
ncbi:MAG: hypothetical protein KAV87_41735 [Desulfobacteraceae bacterium]|nr:hypothetical protein [Desulfobacteraceae bacterium]